MNNHLYHTLEFDKVLEDLSRRALSSLGADRLKSLRLSSDPEVVRKKLGRISELCTFLASGGTFPINKFEDITAALDMASVEGSYLDPRAFRDIHQILDVSAGLHRFFLKSGDTLALLQEIAHTLVPNPDQAEEISRCLDLKSLEIRSGASPALSTIRRTIERTREQVRKELDWLLDRFWRQGVLQERLITKRQGRWVLPVKENHKHRIQGVLHDQSASGATLFIEPLHILDLNNKVRRLEAQERHEEEKILRRLTDLVRSNRTDLEQNLEVLVSLDCVHAMALTSRMFKQHAPALSTGPLLKIRQGRHPLLAMREDAESPVVPLDLSMGDDFNTLVITGPNAGGKTVALKTVGLLALMVSCGIHIPAGPDSEMPIFKRIFAHVGDAQSIENNLSTFSAHVKGIKAIVDEAGEGDLVLIDEIGTGTDPQQGAAMAMAILEVLTERGAMTIVTTHQGTLKAFAHQTPGIANGSMAFDAKTLTPTYRFLHHLPGSSYALEIAERMGIDDTIISRSRSLMGRQAHRLEDLIAVLQDQIQHNEQLEKDLKIQRLKLDGLIKHYQEENDRLSQESGKIRKKAVEEARLTINRANAAVEKAIQMIREKSASRRAIREAKAVIQEEKQRVSRDLEAFSAHQEYGQGDEIKGQIKAGDRVYWKRGAVVATVLSDEDTTGHITIARGDLKLRVPKRELARAKSLGKVAEDMPSRVDFPFPKNVPTEIDLRGMKVEEALEAVDKLVNDALLAGLGEVQVIHGLGTGALRKNVIPFLEQHPLVAEAFPGGARQENLGVTVVRIGSK